MRFTIQIAVGGEAFSEEIARILRDIAERVESGERDGVAVDVNGNTVGEWSI
jgi:hypothetical protein